MFVLVKNIMMGTTASSNWHSENIATIKLIHVYADIKNALNHSGYVWITCTRMFHLVIRAYQYE